MLIGCNKSMNLFLKILPSDFQLRQRFLSLLSILSFGNFGLDDFRNLRDGLILISNILFLLNKIQISLQNIHKERNMSNTLINTSIGKLGTPLQDLMNPINISLWVRKQVTTAQ